MRTFSENPRFLATAFCFSVVALGGASALTGCGGGSANNTPAPVTAASGVGASYAGRSYTIDSITLADGRTGSLDLQVTGANTVAGVLKLTNPVDTVGLTGTVTPATGTFQAHGTLTRAATGVTAASTATSSTATSSTAAASTATAATRATGDSVVVTGTLPTPPNTGGGSATLSVGGQTGPAVTFRGGTGASPSPNPSGSGNPSPSPSGSATPNPTPSPSGTPSPNPTPSTGPGSGTGTLGTYFTGFVSSANDTFTFNYTTQSTEAPDPQGHNDGPSSGTNTLKGPLSPFGAPSGPKDTVTIQLPLSGSKVVTREALINGNTGKVIAYSYYVENASGRADYGTDNLNNDGTISSSSRYEGVTATPYSITPGQSSSTTYTDYETEYDGAGAVTKQYNYTETDRVTFVGIETVTVAAGTFTNVGHFRFETTYTDTDPDNTNHVTHVDSDDYYVSTFAGRVLAKFHNITQNEQGTYSDPTSGEPINYTYTDTFDATNQLASATVNGTNYPPGRAAMSFGQRSNLTFGKALSKHSFLRRFGIQ